MAEQSPSFSSVEETRKNSNIDWRAQKLGFVEQMGHFCEEMADVEFIFNRDGEITVCLFHSLFRYFEILENSGTFFCSFYSLRSVSEGAHL